MVAGMSLDNVSELSHVDCDDVGLFYSIDHDRHVSPDRVKKTNGPGWFMAVGAGTGITAFERRFCEGCRLRGGGLPGLQGRRRSGNVKE